jgi:hypothetical protein
MLSIVEGGNICRIAVLRNLASSNKLHFMGSYRVNPRPYYCPACRKNHRGVDNVESLQSVWVVGLQDVDEILDHFKIHISHGKSAQIEEDIECFLVRLRVTHKRFQGINNEQDHVFQVAIASVVAVNETVQARTTLFVHMMKKTKSPVNLLLKPMNHSFDIICMIFLSPLRVTDKSGQRFVSLALGTSKKAENARFRNARRHNNLLVFLQGSLQSLYRGKFILRRRNKWHCIYVAEI